MSLNNYVEGKKEIVTECTCRKEWRVTQDGREKQFHPRLDARMRA